MLRPNFISVMKRERTAILNGSMILMLGAWMLNPAIVFAGMGFILIALMDHYLSSGNGSRMGLKWIGIEAFRPYVTITYQRLWEAGLWHQKVDGIWEPPTGTAKKLRVDRESYNFLFVRMSDLPSHSKSSKWGGEYIKSVFRFDVSKQKLNNVELLADY